MIQLLELQDKCLLSPAAHNAATAGNPSHSKKRKYHASQTVALRKRASRGSTQANHTLPGTADHSNVESQLPQQCAQQHIPPVLSSCQVQPGTPLPAPTPPCLSLLWHHSRDTGHFAPLFRAASETTASPRHGSEGRLQAAKAPKAGQR
eukprot:1160373-Pelagomonas_calceolata.AAC.9